MLTTLPPILIGLSVGGVLGLTGAGGSIIAVPALIFFCGLPIQQATPIALIAVAAGALVGTVQNLRLKIVRYRAAMMIAFASIPSSLLGLTSAQYIPESILTLLFICILLWVAWKQLRPTLPYSASKLLTLNATTGRYEWDKTTFTVFGLLGSATGFLTGLLGVGGGFIIVPVLRKVSELSMRQAAATSLMTISIVSSISLINASLLGLHAPWIFSLTFALATIVGLFIASLINDKISEKTLKFVFGLLLLFIAILMVIEHFIF